jgi:hypothetical protein
MIRLWFALLMLAATPALAEPASVYEGLAGRARIVMSLTDNNGDVTGAYFYRSSRLDISLSGQRHGQRLDLSSDVTNDKMGLTFSGADLAGVLTTADGRKLAVSLHPAAAPAGLPADLPAGLGLYERLRLAGLSFVAQEAKTQNGKTIRWYREPLTGIRLFRLEGGYATPAMGAMNHALAQHQWSTVSDWLQCTGPDGKPGADTDRSDKPWLGPGYVSYVWRSSWDCAGAAHPDFGAEGHSFDARTGRELTLDEVLPEGRGPIPREDSSAWLDYRSRVFAPAVAALMKRYHPAQMAPPRSDDDCDYTDPDVWAFPNWALTKNGLWLGAIFARVARACDSPDWAVVPWSALPLNSIVRR